MVDDTKTAVSPKAKPRPQACGGCKHVDTGNPSDVVCRRFPPVVLPTPLGGTRCFVPNVHPELDTCGEFKPRRAKAE